MKIAFVNIGAMFRQDYAQLSIFAGLDGNQISQLSPFIEACQFEKDCMVFEQGQPAEYLFILLSGEVVIRYKPYDGPPLNVAHIEPGGVFGWSAALQRDSYASCAVALQPTVAFRMRGSDLPVIRDRYPETAQILFERLAGVIAQRLQSTHTQVLGILTQGLDVEGNYSRKERQK